MRNKGLSYLKVKIKSLAEEARIIRKEERKAKSNYHSKFAKKNDLQSHFNDLRSSLHDHRIHVVRRASRETLLVYGFLRGVPYKKIEPKRHECPGWGPFSNYQSSTTDSLKKMLEKYGPVRMTRWGPEGAEEFKKQLAEQWESFLAWTKVQ